MNLGLHLSRHSLESVCDLLEEGAFECVLLEQDDSLMWLVGGDPATMGYLRHLPHVVETVAADVDVQEE